jgi:hypothetical protein
MPKGGETMKKNDLISINPQVLTGMGIEELEDRLEMQTLGLPVQDALSDSEAGIIIIIIIFVEAL